MWSHPYHLHARRLGVRAKVVQRCTDRVWECGGVSDSVEYVPLPRVRVRSVLLIAFGALSCVAGALVRCVSSRLERGME